MKKICLSLLLISGVVIIFTSCRKVHGEGPVVTESRSTSNFNGIEMAVPGEMYYTPGSSYKVEISAQQNILEIIEAYVKDNVLKVRVKNSINIKSNEPIIVKVTAPDVTALGVNGSGNITVSDPYRPVNTKLSVNGSGVLIVSDLNTNMLEARISGSGKINVYNGGASGEDVAISGSGLIDLAGLPADQANTNTSGSGTIRLHVVSSLDCKISGSGVVMYKGSPKIKTSISGSGRVIPI